ncbi:diacylglycerol/polyprenol kinase family protein [Stratiformator vulcanicus]|uniref:diacylglycerol/polyprenol kinase family protein n=1 Tax=Stratiformator vulcanicus TaxID=2527980 RepID=UPI002877A938|nr:hypothetical protein [Stratiformator vulcanicus]
MSTRLGPQELRRRLWHMAPGFLPFLLWPIPHADPISPTLRGIVAAIGLLLSFLLLRRWQQVSRANHESEIPSIAGYVAAVLLTVVAFPAHLECAFAVLAILAFGDGAATLCGKLFESPRLPWNSQKSLAGLAGFLAVGTPMTALIYWGETFNAESQRPPIDFSVAWQVAAIGVICAAIAESLPVKLNDNIRVGAVAAVAIVTAHLSLTG